MFSLTTSAPEAAIRRFILGYLLISWLLPSSLAAEEGFAGTVKILSGSVTIKRAEMSIPCSIGMRLRTKDLIETGPDSRIGIILHDGTRVALGPKSALSVETFVFQPEEGKFGLLIKMLRGVAAYVSGEIGHFSPKSVQVETPVGFIGLRGTKFAIVLNQTGGAQ